MSLATNVSTCRTSIFAKNSSECHNLPFHFIAFCFGTNLVLGFPPHCYILWLSMKEMIRGQSLEVFVFNTSLIEVIFNFSYVFLIKQHFFNCSDCKPIAFCFGLFLLVGRPLFQTFTCVERYVGVLHPVTFLKLKPIKYRIIISIVGWFLIFCSCLLATVGIIDFNVLLLPQYLSFLVMKVFTGLTVLKALKRPGPGEDVKKKDGLNRDKVKAFRIIQIVLVSSVVTYAPMVICLMLYYILDYNTFLVSWSVCFCSGIMLGFMQPLLYLKRIRKVFLCVPIAEVQM